MTIMEFQERFATEEACREYLFACRWPEGFCCRRCRGREVGAMHVRRRVWQCKRCGAQSSVTAGTVMHNTQTPLRLWFWAAYLVATHHPGISAVQLQRQLGIERHERAWMMLHKLRRAMVAPEREPLKREVEVDEFYLGGIEQGLKGGRQQGKKVLCAAAVEVRGRGSGRLRLAILKDASMPSLSAFVTDTTESGAIVHTDGWKGYNGLEQLGYDHAPLSQGPEPVGDPPYLPRAHRAISNLKAWLHGTHRRASRHHLQAYLDEFVFRHNRRGNPHAAFQTLLGLSTRHQPVSYRQVIDEAA
jgi:ISXO2 transposase-like protein/transposase-like zinc ribbon protein